MSTDPQHFDATVTQPLVGREELRDRLIGAGIAFVVLNIIWAAVARSSELWPSHANTWSDFTMLATDGFQGHTLFDHLGATLGRVTFALVIGGAIGAGFGAVAASSTRARDLTDPLISFMRSILPPALLVFSVLYIGVTNEAQSLIVVTLPVIWVAADGVRRALASRSDNRSRFVDDVVSTARSALLVVWIVVGLAELVVSETGVNSAIWTARLFFRYGMVLVMVLVSAAAFLVLDYLIRFLGRLAARER